MDIQSLSPAPNSRKSLKRVGRGRGSGIGKTCGRGENGQKKRSGGGKGPLFEGGQMSYIRKLPKRGFVSPFKSRFTEVNVEQLEAFDANTVITAEFLQEKGVIGRLEKDGLKILGNGKLTKTLTVKANKFTQSAVKKIQKVGGTIEEA